MSAERDTAVECLGPDGTQLLSRSALARGEHVPLAPASVEPIGSTVVRGPRWMWGNQGIGVLGTVVAHEFARERNYAHGWWCWVKWDNEARLYRYRAGNLDLSLVATAVSRRELPDGVLELEPGVHLLPKGYEVKE